MVLNICLKMKKQNKSRITISLPEPLLDKLKSIAKDESRSLSGLITYLLEKSVEKSSD